MLQDPSRDFRPETVPAVTPVALPPGAFACLDAVTVEIRPIVLPGPRVREKLAAGVPLLHGEDVAVDPGAVAAIWACLLDAFDQLAAPPRDVGLVRAALDGHRLHAEHATVEALVSHLEHVHGLAQAAGLSGALVERLADLAARPVLAAYARQLAPALRLGTWGAGYCPICGAWPVRWEGLPAGDVVTDGAGRSDGEDHAHDVRRLLRCGRCATGWLAGAALCPFCRPTGTLESLAASDSGAGAGGGAFGCRACLGYLLLGVGGDGSPSLAELAAEAFLPPHDRRALRERALAGGFASPTGSGYRLELAEGEGAWEELDDD